MAESDGGWLSGLLGGGGGGSSTLDLYGDLFTDAQKKALQQREMTQGLFRMAETLGKMAQPSRAPPGLGGTLGALGAGLGAFGGGTAEETALKAMEVAEKVKESKQTREWQSKLNQMLMPIWQQQMAQGLPLNPPPASVGATPPAGAPAAAAGFSQLVPGGATRGGNTGPPALASLPWVNPAPGAPGFPSTPNPFGTGDPSGIPEVKDYSQALGGPAAAAGAPAAPDAPPLLPIPPAPPGGRITPADYGVPAAPQQQTGLLGAPDQVVGPDGQPLPQGVLPTMAASYTGGLPGGQLPFRRASAATPGAGPDTGREARIKFWTDQGAPQHVAEGIADRVGVESSYRSDAIGDKGTSGGLYQHHADRLTRLKNYAAQQNRPWTDPNVQDQFAAAEVKGGDAIAARGWPEILAAPDRQTAAKLWDRHFERSAAGPGAQDTVIPSGPRLQRSDLTNVADTGGAAAAPGAAGAGGVIPGLGMTPEALGTLNALMKINKLGSPFDSLLETYYKSPGYLAEKARTEATATKGVELEYGPLIKAAETTADLNARLKLEPQLQAAIEKAKNDPKLAYDEKKAIIDRLSEQEKQIRQAGLEPVEVIVTPPGETPRKITITKAQLPELATGKGIPGLGIPPMSAVKMGEEVLTEEQKADIKSSRDIVTVTLTPPGATRPQEMQVTGAQARAIAEGRAVPSLGIPAMTGIKIGKPVYNPTEAALGPIEAKAIFENHQLATDAATTIETNKQARALLDAGAITGFGADRITALTKLGNALGVTGRNSQEQVANTEAYLATTAGNVGRMIKQFGAGTGLSDADREYAAQMAAGKVTLDETSIRRILDINDRASLNIINRHNQRVSKIAPGATMTDLNVPVPEPYKAPQASTEGAAATARAGAADAIAKGAPRDAVIKRLRDAGISTEGL